MSENRLEALKASSKPALGHVELVALARTQSPNQARKMASSAGWPSRQTEACRSLAVLRRDFGQEVFETFVTTMEHARTEKSVTEPVQDNRRLDMNERLEKNLDRVTDPIAKLRLTAKHGMVEQAKASFAQLMTMYRPFFWSDHDGADILFDTLSEVPRPGMVCMDDKDQVKQIRQHHERVLLAFVDRKEEKTKLIVDFHGATSFFGFTSEEISSVVSDVLKTITAIKPGPHNWRLFRAVATMRRVYLAEKDPVAIQTELWLLQSHLRNGRLFELRREALPMPINDHPEDETKELDPIVDRFLELGWSIEQVREEFLEWIRASVENCRPQWMLAVAGSKCFGYQDKDRTSLMREKFRPKMWESLKRDNGDFYVKMFAKFSRTCFYSFDDKDRESDKLFYRSEFIDMLSFGQLNRVYQLLLTLGHRANILYAELEDVTFREVSKYLGQIMPEAFWKAYSSSRYGVAAAMVQQFGQEACFSEILVKKEVGEIFASQYETIEQEYADVVKKWDDGLPDRFFQEGRGKEWQDAREKLNQQHKEMLQKLTAERNEQISGVTELALSLDQPIRFEDVFAYYVAPNWPKS